MIGGPITAHETLCLTSCYFEQLGTSLCLPLSVGRVHFHVKGCYIGDSFYSNFNKTFCKQTVETLIRRHRSDAVF